MNKNRNPLQLQQALGQVWPELSGPDVMGYVYVLSHFNPVDIKERPGNARSLVELDYRIGGA